MMTCAEAARTLSDQMDHPISWHSRLMLRLHLHMCDGCQQYKKQLALLRRWMKSGHFRKVLESATAETRLDEVARKRIATRLKSEINRTERK